MLIQHWYTMAINIILLLHSLDAVVGMIKQKKLVNRPFYMQLLESQLNARGQTALDTKCASDGSK